MKNKQSAIIYARYSCTKQNECSIETQLDKCRKQAELTDTTITKEIIDRALSAKTMNRDGLQEVLEMVRKREISTIVTYSLSRISRNLRDLAEILHTLQKHGVTLISVKESIDTGTPMGKFIFQLLGCLGEFELDTIKGRVSDALQYRKRSKIRYTNIIPYGFDLVGEQLVENQAEQTVIREIVEMRHSGFSFQKIADRLNDSGIPTRLGKTWCRQVTNQIFQAQNSQSKAA